MIIFIHTFIIIVAVTIIQETGHGDLVTVSWILAVIASGQVPINVLFTHVGGWKYKYTNSQIQMHKYKNIKLPGARYQLMIYSFLTIAQNPIVLITRFPATSRPPPPRATTRRRWIPDPCSPALSRPAHQRGGIWSPPQQLLRLSLKIGLIAILVIFTNESLILEPGWPEGWRSSSFWIQGMQRNWISRISNSNRIYRTHICSTHICIHNLINS